MVSWLFFVQSNSEYQDVMSFMLRGRDPDMICYFVFCEDVITIDGRVFHPNNGYLLAVNFLSHIQNIEVTLDIVGLNPDYLVDLYKIVCKDDNPQTRALTITESAKCIISDKDLKSFCVDKDFRFKDGSSLTILESSNNK